MKNDERHVWRTPNVWGFSLASLFSDWGHEMVTALLPGFLVSLGAPAIALGLTEGVSNLMQAWAAVWGGRQAEYHEHRQAILVAGYVMTGLKALIALTGSWIWVVILRTIAWGGRGARGPIRDTFIAEEVPAANIGKALGLREAFDTAGALLGPLSAAILVAYWTPRELIAWTAVWALLTIFVILRVRDPRRIQNSQKGPRPASQKIIWSKNFLRYRVSTLIFSAGYVAPTFFILRVWQSHELAWGMSAHTLALLLYTLHNALYALSSYPVGWLVDRMASRRLLLMGLGLWTLAVLGFAMGFSGVGSWGVLFGLSGLATGIIETAQKASTLGVVTESARGLGLGQIAAVKGAGQLAAGVIMGILWTLGAIKSGFWIETFLAAAGFIILATFVGDRPINRITTP